MPIQFDNTTPYEALRTDAIDQHGEVFHAVIAKQRFRIEANGLVEDSEPATLNVEDLPYGELNQSSIQHESDLAPFKPRTDVIVNATAYAPEGKPVQRFQVRLWVGLPDTPAPLPPEPQGLNQFMRATPAELEKWQRAVEAAKRKIVPGAIYINKTLTVTGPRHFRKSNALFRMVDGAAMIGSAGLIRSNPWTLDSPQEITKLALRYEYAYGGQCRIESDDPDARNVPSRHWLTKEQQAVHPDKDKPPIAHDACETNPVGTGFSTQWFQDTKEPEATAAPQIEHSDAPVTADLFWDTLRGKASPNTPGLQPQGFGNIGRAWLPRRNLIGNVEVKEQWAEDEFPRLPKDFDFGYWNGAPRDQQIPHLTGNEIFELTNLCAPDHPGAKLDKGGNTVLRFQLPGDRLYLAVGDTYGRLGVKLMAIDTVTIDPEQKQIELVWRGMVSTRARLTNMELRMNRADERQKLDAILALWDQVSQPDTEKAKVANG